MTFVSPDFLYALILVPIAGLFLLWTRRRSESAVARLGDRRLMERLSRDVNRPARRWKVRLWLLALACTIFALARPLWGTEVQMIEQRGVQIMVVLDVSNSMLAEDVKPSRLSRAKLEISTLMNQLQGDEIGLVLFSGASFIQFPLTSDYSTARKFLDAAGPDAISRPGTAIGDAIRTALNGFDPNRASQKVIVLISDGEDHTGDAIEAAQEAVEAGAVIYTIGFGSSRGEPIPEYDAQGEVSGYKKNQQGEVVLTRLDEQGLIRLARLGNGKYFRATADAGEIDALLSELALLQKDQLETLFEVQGIERFQGFLLLGLVALVMVEILPDRTRQRAKIDRTHR